MKQVRWVKLAAVLAVVVVLSPTTSTRADETERAEGVKKTHGRVVRVQADERRLTVRTHHDKEMAFQVDPKALLEADGRQVSLADFKEGAKVKIRYQAEGGTYRALSVKTPVLGEAVKRQVQDFLGSARQFGADQKAQYRQKLEAALDRLDDKLDDLKDRAAAASGEAKRQYAQTIRDLEEKRAVAQEKLDKIMSSGGEAWEDIKSGVSAAVDDLQRSIDRARSRFNKE